MSNEENKDTLTLADQERAAHIAHGLAENPEVLWHDTIFKDLQWYYVEGGMYAVRRLENHKCAFVALVEAKEPFDAVAKVRDGTEWVGQSQLRHIGDTAAMRKAILSIQEYAAAIDSDSDEGNVLAILDECRDALATLPRNCDRFPSELDAQLAFLNEVWLISDDGKMASASPSASA